VSIDGTKIKANASKHKAMNFLKTVRSYRAPHFQLCGMGALSSEMTFILKINISN
jgi:hypothetical protein